MFKAPFSFDGRIRRIEYFLSGIIGGIVSSIAWALGVGTFVLGAASGSAGGSVFGLLIGLAAMIASIWFSLAQGVKRLHDLNKSGWLILLCCVPIIGWIFALRSRSEKPYAISGTACFCKCDCKRFKRRGES